MWVSLAGSQVCHVFGLVKPEESLNESLVVLFGVFESNSLPLIGALDMTKWQIF
ncbi:hypothetical protein [Helicobacter marmotae]|uniref:hypothetical protein n=1 Tax=Helicobacter marmotae TaxID=152490 RepID=UPI00131572C7|nr:hypothetical protein [Helicobacter marmotae]